MFPLFDELPTRRAPIVTITLIAINVLVYLWGLQGAALHEWLVVSYGTFPCELFGQCGNQVAPVNAPTPDVPAVVTLVTSAFVHGGFFHLVLNMLFFWVFGNNIEDSMSRPAYVGFYLSGGVVAAVAQSLLEPASRVPQIGASGAVATVMGAYLVLYPRARIYTIVFVVIPLLLPLRAWFVAGVWGIGQFIASTEQVAMIDIDNPSGGVAHVAHFAGFLFGMLLAHVVADPTDVYRHLYARGAPPRTRGLFGQRIR